MENGTDSRLKLELASHYAAVKTYEDQMRERGEGLARARVQDVSFEAMTHELFVGLSLISGPLDDYLATMPESPQRTSLEGSRRSLHRVARTLSALNEMSSLDTRRLKGSFACVNFGRLTTNIGGTFRKALETPRIKYIIDCDTKFRRVFVDRDKFERILFMLIGNAFRFSREGHVKVSVWYEGERAMVSVEDTGVGIPGALPQA